MKAQPEDLKRSEKKEQIFEFDSFIISYDLRPDHGEHLKIKGCFGAHKNITIRHLAIIRESFG